MSSLVRYGIVTKVTQGFGWLWLDTGLFLADNATEDGQRVNVRDWSVSREIVYRLPVWSRE